MTRLSRLAALVPLLTPTAFSQGRLDWMTAGNDPQRSSWIRSDVKISPQSMSKPGFAFLWKVKLNNEARGLHSITPPSLMDRYIGYRGFRSFGFLGGSSNVVYALDTDLARVEWERKLGAAPAASSPSPECAGGLTANVTRPTVAEVPAMFAGRGGGGFGRGTAARSGVGEPMQGAVTLAQIAARQPPPPPPGANRGGANAPGRGGPGAAGRGGPGALPGGFNPFARGPAYAHALGADGLFYSLYVSNGEDGVPPVPFLPANANAHGLLVVGNVAYVATSGGCGGAANGVWALDIATRQVATWKTGGAGVVGGAGIAMGTDGTVYAATGPGPESAGSYSNALVSLEPKTLALKSWYKPGGAAFATSPLLFTHKDRAVVAVASSDGTVHLLDAANPGGADHKTALHRASLKAAGVDGLATWEDAAGARWLLAATSSAVSAWKVVDANGSLALEAGWVSREMISPLTPTVMNGVVFAVSSGEFRPGDARVSVRERVQKSRPAVLYALDAATGKEFWNSGNAIASFARGGVSGGGSQLYVTTHDSTLYAFGFPIEH